MPEPVAPSVPLPALRSDPDTFAARAEANVSFFAQLVSYASEVVSWVTQKSAEVTATAASGTLGDITGFAGSFTKVNDAEDGLDFSPSGLTGRAVLEAETDPEARGVMGLLSASTRDTGTTEGTVPLIEAGDVLADSIMPVGSVRAWVNFNGTGTPAIRASKNVTSITDRGVGLFTLNFTAPMPDALYSGFVNHAIGGAANNNRGGHVVPVDASSCWVNTFAGAASTDEAINDVIIVR